MKNTKNTKNMKNAKGAENTKNSAIKKIFVTVLSLAMVLALTACGGGSGSGDSEEGGGKLAAIQEKGKIVVCTDAAWAPFEYIGADGEPTGVDIEIANKIAEELGVELEISNIAFDSISTYLENDEADLALACITITDERKQAMDISTPYMENKQVMVVKKENAEKFTQSAKDAKVVAEKGSAGEEVVKGDEFFKESKYTAADSQAKALMEVKAGTSDIAIIDFVMSKGTIR
ncbi:MAG: amino acid ABC transporter substrate-binding protein, partial [Mogibacterium sp.]|nr:amino acid ABC transporter substrate-binding protein [Mogibacterium sp.]